MTAPRIPPSYYVALMDWTARTDIGGGYECMFFEDRDELVWHLLGQNDDGRCTQVLHVANGIGTNIAHEVADSLFIAGSDHPLTGTDWDYRDRDREEMRLRATALRKLKEEPA